MALTKTTTTLHDGIALAASGGPTTSAVLTLDDAYGADIDIKLTNGATGPTTAAQVQVQVSPDNSHWFDYGGLLTGKTGNNETISWHVQIPMEVQYARLVSTHPTGQPVTIDAFATELTTLI